MKVKMTIELDIETDMTQEDIAEVMYAQTIIPAYQYIPHLGYIKIVGKRVKYDDVDRV